MPRYLQRRICRAAWEPCPRQGMRWVPQWASLTIPGSSCAPSSPSTRCRTKKAGICSPVLCWKHRQLQLLITGSRLLVGIKPQSFMSIPWPPKGSGLFRRPAGTPLFPGCYYKSGSGDDSLHSEAFHFEAFVCFVARGHPSSTPKSHCQRGNPVWRHLAPPIFLYRRALLQKGNQLALLMVVRSPKISISGCSQYLSLCKPEKHHQHKTPYKILVNKASWKGDRLSSFSLLLSLCMQANLTVSQDLQL